MSIRAFEAGDIQAVAALYRQSVLRLGGREYSLEQATAWALHAADVETFRSQLLQGLTLVMEKKGQMTCFGQLHPAGHIAHLYCDPAYEGRGQASAVYDRLEQAAQTAGAMRLTADASRVARPFFEYKGFRVIEPERVIRNGVELERFKMEKTIGPTRS